MLTSTASSFVCALGSALSCWAHVVLMPPPRLKSPDKTRYFGRLTFLTVQSNVLMTAYHVVRLVAPASALAVRCYPLAFALGSGLSLLYYGLDHFVPAKQMEDKRWIAKGYTGIPVGRHLEHGLALPLAVLDAKFGGHAFETSSGDVYLFVGGYTMLYLLMTLLNKRLTGLWLYPIFDEVEGVLGPAAFWVISLPAVATYVGLGFLGQHLAGS